MGNESVATRIVPAAADMKALVFDRSFVLVVEKQGGDTAGKRIGLA